MFFPCELAVSNLSGITSDWPRKSPAVVSLPQLGAWKCSSQVNNGICFDICFLQTFVPGNQIVWLKRANIFICISHPNLILNL